MKRIVLPIPEDEGQDTTPAPPPPTETVPAARPQAQRKKQTQAGSPELMNILVPSFKVGVATGTCGVFTGATFGILRSAPIGLFALVSGGQWFTLGSVYTAARLTGLKYYASAEPTPREKVHVSTVAGGVAATVAGALRGRANILPGMVLFSLYGAGGQMAVNWWTKRAALAANAPEEEEKPESWWRKYSPIKRITEEDYIKVLEERLLRAEADIALVDEHIQEIRELKRKQEAEAAAAQVDKPAPFGEA